MISSKNNYCENFPYYYGKCMIIGKKDEIQKMHYIEVREKTFILNFTYFTVYYYDTICYVFVCGCGLREHTVWELF